MVVGVSELWAHGRAWILLRRQPGRTHQPNGMGMAGCGWSQWPCRYLGAPDRPAESERERWRVNAICDGAGEHSVSEADALDLLSDRGPDALWRAGWRWHQEASSSST